MLAHTSSSNVIFLISALLVVLQHDHLLQCMCWGPELNRIPTACSIHHSSEPLKAQPSPAEKRSTCIEATSE